MSSTTPPIEAQRFGRSQTPESPRPVYISEPANIPVLMNQMDPVFNDTATYNIPHNQTFASYGEALADQGMHNHAADEHDPVQNFFREAEHQASAIEPSVANVQADVPATTTESAEAILSSSTSIEATDSVSQLNTAQSIAPEDNISDKLETEKGGASESMVSQSQNPQISEQPQRQAAEANLNTNDDNQPTPRGNLSKSNEPSQTTIGEGGVDYQSLLDTIAQSASTAPAAESLTAPTTAASNTHDATHSLPSFPGLPAKPPPQEHPVDFPTFSYPTDTQAQSTAQVTAGSDAQIQANQNDTNDALFSATNRILQNDPQSINTHAVALNGFMQNAPLPEPQLQLAPGQVPPRQSMTPVDARRSQDPSERPWTPRTQAIYDHFLEEERRYVTEGIWDKFPNGSRLFVGNLPSEKVTKRDLFHTFHKYGQLAQISIKQAYGFVQFLEASACLMALNAEQGVEIRGRKVHLEISKPQKNTRNAGSGNKGQARRRSRSPERARGRNYSDYRDEPGRRHDDYRSRRSPSPRGYRPRDEFVYGSREARPRSPIHAYNYGVPPQPSQPTAYDDEAALPLPRRDSRSVPDVQLLVLEPEVVQSFINWVEQAFRSKGLQVSTIWLNQRLPLAAVVKRQIIEGVQAVVKLTINSQNNSKVPLQVFDRTGGATNVTYNEYADLDVQVAADVVLQARARERGPTQPFRPPVFPPQQQMPPAHNVPHQVFSPQNPFGQTPHPGAYPPALPQQYSTQNPQQQQQYSYQTPQGNYRPQSQPPPPMPSNQPPNLQQLLANLRQPTGQTGSPATPNMQNGGAPQQHQYGGSAVQPPYNQFGPAAPLPAYGGGSQQQGHPQQNVQNVMEQLARYR